MTEPAHLFPLIFADAAAWREWLTANEGVSDGIWLVLAKKGTTDPTSLSYQEALEEALCGGWIDGQRRARDAATFVQRYTPRRTRSMWSMRNVDIIARLVADQRIRARGIAEVERAQADGRWERAYVGQAAAEVPDELARALAADVVAEARFAALNRAERYSALHPILTAPSATTRARRIDVLVARLGGSAAGHEVG